MPGRRASRATCACVSSCPWGDSAMRALPAGGRPQAAAMPAHSGSGFNTMPGPPPYGRSSTVRCRSCVCARGSSVPTLKSPRSNARPSTPWRSASSIRAGNSVTTSIRTPKTPPASRSRFRAAQDARVSSAVRSPAASAPAFVLHHHQRTGRRLEEVLQHSEQRPFGIAHREAFQVLTVVLARRRGRQLVALDQNLAVAQAGRAVAINYTLEFDAHRVSIPLPLQHLVCDLAALRPAQAPAAMLQQRLRWIGIGADLQTAAQAMRPEDATEYEIAAQAAATCLLASLR